MKRSMIAFVLVILAPVLLSAQGSKNSLEGVWKVTEIVVTGANASTNSSPLPGLYIFTKGHYSIVTENGTKARPATIGPQSPDAQRLAAYDALTAQSGTYQIKGTTLTTRPLIAKNPNVMAATAQPGVREFKVEGNALSLIQKSAAGQPVSETRTKLVRVE
jgi:hypothetical protein